MVTERGGYKTHPQPPDCSDVVYAVLLRCWARDPAARPDFVVLADEFLLLSDSIIPDSSGSGGGSAFVDTTVQAASAVKYEYDGIVHDAHGAVLLHQRIPDQHGPGVADTGASVALAGYSLLADSLEQMQGVDEPEPVLHNAARVASQQQAAARPSNTSVPGHGSAHYTLPDAHVLKETPYGTVVENESPYGTAIDSSTPPLQLGRSIRPSSATPGTVSGFAKELYAAAPEEMLGWTKPRDVISIYEDVGRPNLMPSENGNAYTRSVLENEDAPLTSAYAQSISVGSIVRRELSALAWQELDVLSDDTPLPQAMRGTTSSHSSAMIVPTTGIIARGDKVPLSSCGQHIQVGADDVLTDAPQHTRTQQTTPANETVLRASAATAELASVAVSWQHSSEC